MGGVDFANLFYNLSGGEYESLAAALVRQQDDWLSQDLPAKAELLLQELELRDQLAQLEQRRQALLGEQETISLKYERLLNDFDRRGLADAFAAAAYQSVFFRELQIHTGCRFSGSPGLPASNLHKNKQSARNRTFAFRKKVDERFPLRGKRQENGTRI